MRGPALLRFLPAAGRRIIVHHRVIIFSIYFFPQNFLVLRVGTRYIHRL